MAPRYTIRFLLAVTTYAALISAMLSHESPLWRLTFLYAIVAFTPGALGPMMVRGVRRRTDAP